MTEPKPVVLPLHHDPIAMQKYELFLKLARVSPKKMQKKCIFGCFEAFSSEKKRGFDALSRFFEWLSSGYRVIVKKESINDCATIVEEFDCISLMFQRHFYNLSMYLEGFSRVRHQDEKCARTYPLIYIMRKTGRTLAISYFFCNFAPL